MIRKINSEINNEMNFEIEDERDTKSLATSVAGGRMREPSPIVAC